MNRIDDFIYNLLSGNDGKQYTFKKVTTNALGAAISDADVDGVVYVKQVSTGEYFQNTTDVFTPEMWGARRNGTTNDRPAFVSAIAHCTKIGAELSLSAGTYKINGKLTITCSFLGASMYGTRLNFTGSSDDVAIEFGGSSINNLRLEVGKFTVTGKSTMDGWRSIGIPPYSNAFHDIYNIFIQDVRDGVWLEESSSIYKNSFTKVTVQKYARNCFRPGGAYNVFRDCFGTQPNGETNVTSPDATKGANNLGVYDVGGNTTLENVQTEDQWSLSGGSTKVINCTIEYLLKGQPSSIVGRQAFKINGANVTIDGFTLIGMPNTIVDQLGVSSSLNCNISGLEYINPDSTNHLFTIEFPFIPSVGSTGSITNYTAATTFNIDNAAFAQNFADWSLDHCSGLAGARMSRKLGLVSPPETDPLSLHLTGGHVTGPAAFDEAKTFSLETQGIHFMYSSTVIRNKADTDYIAFLYLNGTGTETMVDISNVGTIKFRKVPPSFADNAAAITGGLEVGNIYHTSGVLKIVF